MVEKIRTILTRVVCLVVVPGTWIHTACVLRFGVIADRFTWMLLLRFDVQVLHYPRAKVPLLPVRPSSWRRVECEDANQRVGRVEPSLTTRGKHLMDSSPQIGRLRRYE